MSDASRTADSVKSLVGRVLITSAVAALLISAAVWAVAGPRLIASAVAGFAVALVSFLVLVIGVTGQLPAGRSSRSKTAIVALSLVKLALLGLALWWLISRDMVEPATFLAGFTSIVIALIVEGVRMRRWEARR